MLDGTKELTSTMSRKYTKNYPHYPGLLLTSLIICRREFTNSTQSRAKQNRVSTTECKNNHYVHMYLCVYICIYNRIYIIFIFKCIWAWTKVSWTLFLAFIYLKLPISECFSKTKNPNFWVLYGNRDRVTVCWSCEYLAPKYFKIYTVSSFPSVGQALAESYCELLQ